MKIPKPYILYVDDEKENLDGFYYSFFDEYEIFMAYNYPDAIRILGENEIEVMIVDQKMPNLSGIEIIKKTKSLYPDITYILITAYASLKDALQAVNEANIFRFLSKPWNDEIVRKSLSEAVNYFRIKKQNVQLLNELQTQNVELQRAYKDVQQSSKLKTAFLANLSHEIRTPLNAIVGFSNLMAELNIDADKQKEFADLILQNSNDLLTMIDQIVNVSKIDSKLQVFNKSVINLNDILTKVYKKHESLSTQQVRFLLDLPEELMGKNIVSDARQLEIVFDCLVKNAFKFTNCGHVKIGATFKKSEGLLSKGKNNLQTACANLEECLLLYIEDTGLGIHSDYHNEIFEPFRKLSDDTGSVISGIGMGLYHASKIIHALGGELFLASEPSKGTSFYFCLAE